MRQSVKNAFRGLRAKLTLTYTLVTVGALLALEIVLLTVLVVLLGVSRTNETQYIFDIYTVMGFRAANFLAEDDQEGLQAWVDQRYASGFASEEPFSFGEAPAAPFASGHELYLLDTDGTVLAQSPSKELIGQTYSPPDSIDPTWFTYRTIAESFDPLVHYEPMADGSWFVVLPIYEGFGEAVNHGAMVMNIEPPPSFLSVYLPLVGSIVGVTAVALLIGVTPFGALFGYLMALNLTRRLAKLETAASAWSQGKFDVMPQDASTDEIGRLGARLKEMANQIETLLQSRQELATLEERNRLARELHDTVKQQNFATLMQVRAAKNLASQNEDAPKALNHLELAEDLLKQSQQDLKHVIEELRPAQLEGQGVATALRSYAATWSDQNGIPAVVTVQGERPLPLNLEQTLYRVTQETLANIARHSNATQAEIQLSYAPEAINLTIADNGQGFDIINVQRGFGLATMQQRLAEANGTLNIASDPENGTAVIAKINLQKVAEQPE